MEQYIAQLEGIPSNWKMEQVTAYYGKPSEIPTHATRGKVFPVSAFLSYSSPYMPGGLAYFILQRIMYPWRRPSIVCNSDTKLQGTTDGYTEIKNMSAEKKEQWLFIKPKDENNVPILWKILKVFCMHCKIWLLNRWPKLLVRSPNMKSQYACFSICCGKVWLQWPIVDRKLFKS